MAYCNIGVVIKILYTYKQFSLVFKELINTRVSNNDILYNGKNYRILCELFATNSRSYLLNEILLFLNAYPMTVSRKFG